MAQISDSDRKHLEEALAAALLALYMQEWQKQYDALGIDGDIPPPSDDAKKKIAAKAAETALLIQQGINQRLDSVGQPDGPTLEDVQQEIQQHNDETLQPYLESFGVSLAFADVMSSTPNPDDPGKTMQGSALFNWVKTKIFDDECLDAEQASPATWDDLMAIAGGTPPRHRNCGCFIELA